MKNITINFDIIDKIHQAKGELKLQRTTKNTLKFATPFTAISVVSGTISCLIHQGIPEKIIPGTIIYQTAIIIIPILGPKLLYKLSNTSEESNAYTSLSILSKELELQNIQTNPTLLINTILYKKRYKLNFGKKQIPTITENKQLIIPIEDDEGNITEVNALQQHTIGSWQYKLTFNTKRK